MISRSSTWHKMGFDTWQKAQRRLPHKKYAHGSHFVVFFITRDSEVMFSPSVCLCVRLCVCRDILPHDLTVKDWCHTNNILQACSWGCVIVQVVSRSREVIHDVTMLKSRSNFEVTITRLVYIIQHGNKYCHNMFLTGHLYDTLIFRFQFRFQDRRRLKMETVSRNFRNPCLYMIALIGLQIWKFHGISCKRKPISPRWRHQRRHSVTFNIALYIHVYERKRVLGQYLGNEYECRNHFSGVLRDQRS